MTRAVRIPVSAGPDPFQREKKPSGVVDPFQVVRHLAAEKALRERVILIPLQFDGFSRRIVDGDNHSAGIGAVVGANGPDGSQRGFHVSLACRF